MDSDAEDEGCARPVLPSRAILRPSSYWMATVLAEALELNRQDALAIAAGPYSEETIAV